ncbi:MAG: lysylphosphatidylglycerol synthase transmembrane domain-containing protein [Oscillospiraceae bacterium]|nr:lysylphosphatidylglycerol synthase transmembrane domain-containing protein [Oscillospiraceae bacterium]
MTVSLLFALAVLLLAAGHYFRSLRWMQLIQTYENPPQDLLLWSLSCGYTINFFAPLRLGDLVRSLLLGRKLDNGFSLALSTTLIDYCFDIPSVCVMFFVLRLLYPENAAVAVALRWYALFTLILFVLFAVAIALNKSVKQLARSVCSIFNRHIEFSLLFFCWSCIVCVKDVYRGVNKLRLLLNTLVMWALYLASYEAIACFINKVVLMEKGAQLDLTGVLLTLFSPSSLGGSLAGNVGGTAMNRWFSLYMLATLVVLLLVAAVMTLARRRGKKSAAAPVTSMHKLLPQIHEADRLEFLDLYFSGEKRDFISKYLELNRDVSVLQNLSGGSYATTLLCMDANATFYRKYAFSKDCAKLREQVEWISAHTGALPVPTITGIREGEGYYCYDMRYDAASVSFFNYIHSSRHEDSLRVLLEALDAVRAHVHIGLRPARREEIDAYIDKKVTANLQKLREAKALRALGSFDYVTINGREYHNLPLLEQYFAPERLRSIFEGCSVGGIHGDLTVDNIVCYSDGRTPDYYIIDPNGGNILDTPLIDYGKMLQSLHGNYEFYMRTESAKVERSAITYIFTRSASYQYLYEKYKAYLFEHFSAQDVRGIYYHEIVNWLRLLPYKLEKDEARFPAFYAGFLIVVNDVIELFGGMDEDKTCDL